MNVRITCRGNLVTIPSALIDTGSDSTCFEADILRPLGLLPDPDEVLQVIRGVGGSEYLYSGLLDALAVGDLDVGPVKVNIGRMGYGFGIDAILGMEFLEPTGAIIDLPARLVRFNPGQ